MNHSARRVERRRPATAGVVALLALLAGVSCGDNSTAPDAERLELPPVSAVISNPIANAAAAQANGTVYVSMPPGTVAVGEHVQIRNASTGFVTTTPLIDGGFDPVDVPASVGQTLIVTVLQNARATARTELVVEPRRPPTVVRTSPAAKKRDVPLNAVVVLVFSEPIDGMTASSENIRLLHKGAAVTGTIELSSGGLIAEFRPDMLLARDTDYIVQVTTGVMDSDGDALVADVLVTFRTSASGLTPGVTIMPNPIHALMNGGGQAWIRAFYVGSDGIERPDIPLVVRSSDESVITVSGTTIDALFHASVGFVPGSATITVSSGELTATAAVLVEEPPLDALSLGVNRYACYLTAAGTAYCEGSNEYGQLGLGFEATGSTPTPIALPGFAFEAISSGWYHSCALDDGGSAHCWGSNKYGQLGDGTYATRSSPVRVAGTGVTFRQIGSGYSHTCGLAQDGSVYCWGAYGWAMIDSITPDPAARIGPTATRVPDAPEFTTISVGGFHACGINRIGAAHCWGLNVSGALGDGSLATSYSPVAVRGDHQFIAISAGGAHTCAVTAAGAAYCWGDGAGLTDAGNFTEPTRIDLPQGVTLVDIATSDMLTCGLTAAGEAYCWGWTWPCSWCDEVSIPPQRVGQTSFKALDAGELNRVCGLTTASALACWAPESLVTGAASTQSSVIDAHPPSLSAPPRSVEHTGAGIVR